MALVSDLGLANKIEWTGFKNDVHREMETMHAFILPSLFGEGLPMVLIEAMSVGIPVIASRIEGIPEVISSRGVGLLVLPDNVDDLVKAIQMLINGEVSVQSVVTVAHARQKVFFSDISMATSVASVYDRLFT
jgi:glycosyltransferase involved in cell wall biosynthesis